MKEKFIFDISLLYFFLFRIFLRKVWNEVDFIVLVLFFVRDGDSMEVVVMGIRRLWNLLLVDVIIEKCSLFLLYIVIIGILDILVLICLVWKLEDCR